MSTGAPLGYPPSASRVVYDQVRTGNALAATLPSTSSATTGVTMNTGAMTQRITVNNTKSASVSNASSGAVWKLPDPSSYKAPHVQDRFVEQYYRKPGPEFSALNMYH